MSHKHKWYVCSSSLCPPCLMLKCLTCSEHGIIHNPTLKEWEASYHAPSNPFPWSGAYSRVEILKHNKLNKGVSLPVFNDIKTDLSLDSRKDGTAISEVLILDHGLFTDRFRKLPYERMLYCEELLCSIIQNLCAHLTLLSDIRKNSPVIGLPPPY